MLQEASHPHCDKYTLIMLLTSGQTEEDAAVFKNKSTGAV